MTNLSFAALYGETHRRQNENKAACVDRLRDLFKVAAIHPDDGWVNRKENTVELTYPSYRRDVQIGDLIALGSESCDVDPIGRFRLVRVTGAEKRGLLVPDFRYSFVEEVGPFDLRAIG
jgi:hypothetical protein